MVTNNYPKRNWLRFAARFIGTAAASYWGIVLLLHLIFGDEVPTEEGTELIGVLLGLLIVAAVASTIYAWRDERRGGIALLLIGTLLSIFALVTAGNHYLFAILVSGAPFLLSGFFLPSANGNQAECCPLSVDPDCSCAGGFHPNGSSVAHRHYHSHYWVHSVRLVASLAGDGCRLGRSQWQRAL